LTAEASKIASKFSESEDQFMVAVRVLFEVFHGYFLRCRLVLKSYEGEGRASFGWRRVIEVS
jgi:hypothetical protein